MEPIQGNLSYILFKSNWIKVLSESAMKILMYFDYCELTGERLINNYKNIMASTCLSKSSVSSGLQELESFFILNILQNTGKIKIYLINRNLYVLTERLVEFLKNSSYKKIILKFLNDDTITETEKNKIEKIIKNKENSIEKVIFNNILFLKNNNNDLNFYKILGEGSFMEEIFFSEEDLNLDSKTNWQSILLDEEKNNTKIMDIVNYFADIVGNPTRDDIDLIKSAYDKCYPFQIKNAILITKKNKDQGGKFNRFSYIYKRLINGMYGTREKNNAKKDFAKEKKNNQANLGFNKSNRSRKEMIELMRTASREKSDFNFDTFLDEN